MCVSVCVFSLNSKACFVEPLKMDAEDKWVVFSTPRMETLEYANCALKIKTSSRKIEGGESPDLRYARRWRTKKAHFKTTTERRILSAGHFMCLGTAEPSPVFWQTTDWSHIFIFYFFFEDWWHLGNVAAAWSLWEDIQNQFGFFVLFCFFINPPTWNSPINYLWLFFFTLQMFLGHWWARQHIHFVLVSPGRGPIRRSAYKEVAV